MNDSGGQTSKTVQNLTEPSANPWPLDRFVQDRLNRPQAERFHPAIRAEYTKLHGLINQADRQMPNDPPETIESISPDAQNGRDRQGTFAIARTGHRAIKTPCSPTVNLPMIGSP